MQARTIQDLLWQAIDAYHNGCGVQVDVTLHVHDNANAVDAVEFATNVHPERWEWRAEQDSSGGCGYVVAKYTPGYPAVTLFLPLNAVVDWMEYCGRSGRSPELNEQDQSAARSKY